MQDLPAQLKKCDFCAQPGHEILEMVDFVMGHGLRSVEGWCVCLLCKHFVEIEDVSGLLKRALDFREIKTNATLVAVTDLHTKFWRVYKKREFFGEKARADVKQSPIPPWVAAIESRFEALKQLEYLRKLERDPQFANPFSSKKDITTITVAETYSFSGDAFEAIKTLATKVPHDSPLWPDQIPGNGQGWWWFDPALPVKTHSFSDNVNALLWGFTSPLGNLLYEKYKTAEGTLLFPAGSPQGDVDAIFREKEKSYIAFSAYTWVDLGLPNNKIQPMPSIQWRWFFGETLHDMMARSLGDYRVMYGFGGKFEKAVDAAAGEEQTLKSVHDLSAFFMASCVWLEQDYLELEPKPIERHRRKAFVREHKLTKPPSDVQVIALRKRKASDSPDPNEPSSGEGHRLTCQFLVEGHLRNQPYGPGRAYRKLIFIDPYPKGPKDAPFRPPKKRVYAVVR